MFRAEIRFEEGIQIMFARMAELIFTFYYRVENIVDQYQV